MPTKSVLLLALASGLLTIPPASAYPIAPVPLWPLTEKAEVVVVATVLSVAEVPPPPGENYVEKSHRARLAVIETLKGPETEEIEVPYEGNMICPAPPLFLRAEKVVAFLARDEDGELTPVALSYGTLYPRKSDLGDVTKMVRKAVEIQGTGLETEQLAERKRRWLVEAAARPGTRWHGLYELNPESEVRSFWDSGRLREPKPRLLPEDKSLVALAFVTARRQEPSLQMLLEILEGHADTRVDLAAMSWIEAELQSEKPVYWTQSLIATLLRRLGAAELGARLGVEAGELPRHDAEALRGIWSQVKLALDLPTVRPQEIEADPKRVRPVGENTPP